LRAIAAARESSSDANYLDEWKALFIAVCVLYRMRAQLPEEKFEQSRANLERRIDELLLIIRTQPGDQKIQNRLRKQRPHLLGCLYEPAAEPTNNRAERSLRPAVIARKLSSGNKTVRGKTTWEILASLAATCHQTSQNFIEYLTPRLPLECSAATR